MKKPITLFLAVLSIFTLFSLPGCKENQGSDADFLMNLQTEFTVNDTLPAVTDKTAHIVLLYGQSNATGVSSAEIYRNNHPTDYAETESAIGNVYINFLTENGNNTSNNTFVPCSFSCGAAANYYGPEVGIAACYAENCPEEDVFIIKYSFGGTTLDDQWLDGNGKRGRLYDAAVSFTLSSLSYLQNIGYSVQIDGICWMQGESDACSLNTAQMYKENTKKLISFFRQDLSEYGDTVPFIDAQISEVWTYENIVNNAKEKTADAMNNVYYLKTQPLGLSTGKEPSENPDIAHYDSESMITLGKAFGEELLKHR